MKKATTKKALPKTLEAALARHPGASLFMVRGDGAGMFDAAASLRAEIEKHGETPEHLSGYLKVMSSRPRGVVWSGVVILPMEKYGPLQIFFGEKSFSAAEKKLVAALNAEPVRRKARKA